MPDPVHVKSTGSFRRHIPSPSLRKSFASVWIHRLDATCAPPMVITPDATIDLQWIDGSFRIAGPDRDPITEHLPDGEVVIGFRFHPAASARWLGVSLVELVGHREPLENLWGKRARHMASRVRVDGGFERMLSSIDEAVAAEEAFHGIDARMRKAFDLIERSAPPETQLVPWLMRALDLSERTLRRRFGENFGYGPKTLDRILRYQRFVKLSSRSNSSTAIMASEAGYSDQSHLVRETRRLTGNTPRQLERLQSVG